MRDVTKFFALIIKYFLPAIIILGLLIGASMLKNGLMYGDPMCAFKQCIVVKENS